MNSNELSELVARAEAIVKQDMHLGKLLIDMLLHLGDAHGIDAQTADAEAQPVAPAEQMNIAEPTQAPAQEENNGN